MVARQPGRRWLNLSLATLLFLVSLFCGALAGFRFGYQRGASAFLEADVYAKAYQVGDLVERRPLDDGTTVVDADRLIESIESIEPRTWMAHGGAGSVQFVPDKQFLVVSQNPWGHKQVELMLRTMRRNTYVRAFHVDYLMAATSPPSRDVKAELDSLKRDIVTTVAPESWSEQGGHGSIAVFETNLTVVVDHHEEIHRQIEAILKARRSNVLGGLRAYDVGAILANFADPDVRLQRLADLIGSSIHHPSWKNRDASNAILFDVDGPTVFVTGDADVQLEVIDILKQLSHREIAEMALAPARSE